MDALTNRARAFSYLRFSRAEQLEGDSLRRQTAAARDYAERNGLDLDDSLNLQDLGVSAFRGKNATEGALAAFIEAVDGGKVPVGSYLLVENLDRLSRDKIMPALNRFSALLEKGVNVVTLTDGKVYTADSLNNLPDLMLSLLVMSRAHDESAMKSQRLRAVWRNKKERAANGDHVLTKWAPAWLRVNNESFEVIPERAAIVKRIFQLTLEGRGYVGIARQFNVEKVPPFSKSDGWHHSYVKRILENEAVIGRYQPMKDTHDESGKRKRVPDGDPIEGYYPAIISESDFYRVRHSKPGISAKRAGSLPQNVLSGLAVCGKCGGKMHFINKGKPSNLRRKLSAADLVAVPDQTYLHCDNSRRKGTCDAKAVRYQPALEEVLEQVRDFRDIEPDGSAVKARNDEIDTLTAEIAETQAGIETAIDALLRVPSQALEKRLGELESQLISLKAKKAEIQEKQIIDDGADPFEGKPYDTFLDTSPRVLSSKESPAILIAHINAELKRMVGCVELERDKPVRVIQRMD